MVPNLIIIGLGVIFVWLITLSILFWKYSSHYNNLTKGAGDKNLKTILDNLLIDLEKSKRDLEGLKVLCTKIQKEGLLHIQKVGLVRFNPFKDTGGDQSFVLSLMDGNDTGVVISGLYSRSGTRWYAKKIAAGKGLDYDLSEEEKKALKEAGTIKA